jgi:SAM-dependent methyltransferase
LHVKYRTAEIPWFAWVHAQLALRPGDAVLEAGCGNGSLWDEPQVEIPEGVALTVTDLSPGMVELATTRARASGRFGAVAGRTADLQAMPFDDSSFDVVVADHMLYHLPDPESGVRELARMVRDEGRVVAATNGRDHLRELNAVRAAVFGVDPVDSTVAVFGAEVGFCMLRRAFDEVRWLAYPDVLRCTDPADVVAYLCSMPPGEDAELADLQRLEREVEQAFAEGGGTLTITKDTGCFVCRGPIRPADR